MKFHSLLVAALLGAGQLGVQAAPVLASFDDLPSLPAVTGATGLYYANGASLSYRNVIWDERFSVVGDAYRVAPPDGPLFGLPQSGHHFVTNVAAQFGGEFTNDHLFISTDQVLTEAWFGQNEYYGYGGGADEVTVHALHGLDVLASVSLALPDDVDGQPELLRRMDTSVFLSLSGITGYRIDRHERGSLSGNWVGDNFVFQPAQQVPEAPTGWLALLGLAAIGARRRMRS
ncbi:hypothetical protein [Inhella sp.]|uniref:hypothetical protein n=1 Tax=Inhella sp. TaxID=1921806 RepID=UPI0035ADAF63